MKYEDIFKQWSSPPGKSEKERCENAETTIRNAIKRSDELKKRDISVFVQGSYKNNTNVRQNSDVDIGVVCNDVFFPDYPEGTTRETFGNIQSDYEYGTFKNEVQEALIDYFGSASVSRGNKAINIRENSYHVEADVAPFFEHRRYQKNGYYITGVALKPDNGKPNRVKNWPSQHYDNGVSKNDITQRRYKALVRIIKRLRIDMVDNNVLNAKPIIGFLTECLIWNVPNQYFGNTYYTQDVKNCLQYLYEYTLDNDKCSDWGEVSELKYLFRPAQKWTRQQVNTFISDAWNYLEF